MGSAYTRPRGSGLLGSFVVGNNLISAAASRHTSTYSWGFVHILTLGQTYSYVYEYGQIKLAEASKLVEEPGKLLLTYFVMQLYANTLCTCVAILQQSIFRVPVERYFCQSLFIKQVPQIIWLWFATLIRSQKREQFLFCF